ncbi:MAG: PilZ domain-containing protein [Sedimenticola sp.]|nr:PilZ domain-containing protein [Sedimenticola sp.]
MSEKDPAERPKGVSFEGRMKISWLMNAATHPTDSIERSQRNCRLLQALLVAQDPHHDPVDTSADLLRIEAKVDLLLDMVSRLLQQMAPDTVESEVEIWLEGMCWSVEGGGDFAVNQQLMLQLYLDAHLTQPLELAAVVTGVEQQNRCCLVEVRFNDLGEQVSDLLGKFIFRQHRRLVAKQRADKRKERNKSPD